MPELTVDRSGCTAKRHGDPAAYTWHGCCCPDAREATRLYRKRLREGRLPPALVDAVGATRRLQALSAMGHTAERIAHKAGLSCKQVTEIRAGHKRRINARTRAAIAAAYTVLVAVPPVDSPCLVRDRRHARTVGWLPPTAWHDIDNPDEAPDVEVPVGEDDTPDDEVVRRLLAGVRTQARPVDKEAAARVLYDRGELLRMRNATALGTSWRWLQRRADMFAAADKATAKQEGTAA